MSRFIPETARRVADPMFTRDLFMDEYYISQFVERREQLLQEVLQGLDIDSKAALALIYMRNGRVESPVELQSSEKVALERLGSDLGGCLTALEALKGSLVVHTHVSGESVWLFKHPTIGDAYAAILVNSPEHLGIFIQGSAPERLIDQVTCGDVNVEKSIVIPRSLFPLMLAKLDQFTQSNAYKSDWLSKFGAKRDLHGFLSRRCSKEFLTLYLQHNLDLLNEVCNPGLFLDTVPEVQLAERLHEFGLLPQNERRKFVEKVSEYALSGQDAHALVDDGIRTLFTEEEFEELVQRARKELLPKLDEVRREWESNHLRGESPEEYMQGLLDIFDALKKQFGDDEEVASVIQREMQLTQQWIDDHTEEEPKITPRTLGKVEADEKPNNARGIFDDVDAGDEMDTG